MELEQIQFSENDKTNIINLGWGGSWRSMFVQPEVLGSVMRAEIAISKLRNNNEWQAQEIERLYKVIDDLHDARYKEHQERVGLSNQVTSLTESAEKLISKYKQLEKNHTVLLKESIKDKEELIKAVDSNKDLEHTNQVLNDTISNYDKTVAKLEQENETLRNTNDCLEDKYNHIVGQIKSITF